MTIGKWTAGVSPALLRLSGGWDGRGPKGPL